jgi:hypothetical protein
MSRVDWILTGIKPCYLRIKPCYLRIKSCHLRIKKILISVSLNVKNKIKK